MSSGCCKGRPLFEKNGWRICASWNDRLNPDAMRMMIQIMTDWKDTPYMDGQRKPKIGVDCVNLIAGTYDKLFCRDQPTQFPMIVRDDGIRDTSFEGLKVVQAFIREYGLTFVPSGQCIMAGDIVMTKAEKSDGGRANHAALAIPSIGVVLHARPPRTAMSSLRTLPDVVSVLRPIDVAGWGRH